METKVYVIDDDEAVRHSLEWLLESAGFHASTYDTAQHFLDDVDGHAYGCAIIDVHMPEIDGLALQKILAQRCPSLPVFFITGGPEDALTRQAQAAGAAGFFTKPLDGERLVGDIHTALDRMS